VLHRLLLVFSGWEFSWWASAPTRDPGCRRPTT
jgi:hypothetical protein